MKAKNNIHANTEVTSDVIVISTVERSGEPLNLEEYNPPRVPTSDNSEKMYADLTGNCKK